MAVCENVKQIFLVIVIIIQLILVPVVLVTYPIFWLCVFTYFCVKYCVCAMCGRNVSAQQGRLVRQFTLDSFSDNDPEQQTFNIDLCIDMGILVESVYQGCQQELKKQQDINADIQVAAKSNICQDELLDSMEKGSSHKSEEEQSIDSNIFHSEVSVDFDSVSQDGSALKLGPDVCSVCLNRFVPGDVTLTLPCSHYFHKQCAAKWFKFRQGDASCPLCRQSILGDICDSTRNAIFHAISRNSSLSSQSSSQSHSPDEPHPETPETTGPEQDSVRNASHIAEPSASVSGAERQSSFVSICSAGEGSSEGQHDASSCTSKDSRGRTCEASRHSQQQGDSSGGSLVVEPSPSCSVRRASLEVAVAEFQSGGELQTGETSSSGGEAKGAAISADDEVQSRDGGGGGGASEGSTSGGGPTTTSGPMVVGSGGTKGDQGLSSVPRVTTPPSVWSESVDTSSPEAITYAQLAAPIVTSRQCCYDPRCGHGHECTTTLTQGGDVGSDRESAECTSACTRGYQGLPAQSLCRLESGGSCESLHLESYMPMV